MNSGPGNVNDLVGFFGFVEVVFASNDSQFTDFHNTVASGQDVILVEDGTTASMAELSQRWNSPLNGDLVWEFSGCGVNAIGDSGRQTIGYGPADCTIVNFEELKETL